MDMSKAAIAPRQPRISAQDEAHPLFPIYRQHRAFCAINLIEASAFTDWLYQYESNLRNERVAAHKRYPEFLAWMRANKGGARQCPAGQFPHNFNYWLEGGRW